MPTTTASRPTTTQTPPLATRRNSAHPCPHFGELVHAIVRAYSSPPTTNTNTSPNSTTTNPNARVGTGRR